MNSSIIPMLYIDIQSLPPTVLCEACGGECYSPTERCLRCERSEP